MDFTQYIKPELAIVIPMLYVLGLMLKQTKAIKDKWIPTILGGVGVVVCYLYIISVESFSGIGAFTAVTQGILSAGTAVYVNQLVKQAKK